MKTAQWLLLLGAVTGLAVILLVSRHKQAVLKLGLPPRIVCADRLSALTLAGAGAIPVLGTGSMSPFIPSAPKGSDPMQMVVAFAVIDPAATFDEITIGALCVYAPDWTKNRVMHQAASKDAGGWIMSGLNNSSSEAFTRITPQQFVGIVAKVYVW